ncbi:MAG: hypothetical protein HRU25_03205 [Psychrobium sp.]|nr:hypothetical protein [Psychrobium sp.]
MSTKFFGQFLYEKGLLSTQKLSLAIELQKKANPSLGQLAINEGFLNETQAEQVNLEQQRTDQRFGSLAISLGFMTDSQVELLFHTQQELRKFFGEILVEQGFISEEVVTSELAEHADLKNKTNIKFDELIENHQYKRLFKEVLEISSRNFTRMPKISVQVADATLVKAVTNAEHIVISQIMHIPEPVKIGWVLNKELAISIGNAFLGMDVSQLEDVYIDSGCEFLNIILGNVIGNYETDGATRLEPPVVIRGDVDYQLPFKTVLNAEMTTPQQDFSIFLMHD